MEWNNYNEKMEWNCMPCLKEAVMNATNYSGWQPVVRLLELAVQTDSVEHKQLKKIKEIDGLYKSVNIVQESCKRGYTELLRVFLNSGIPPDYKVDHFGKTLLHSAAYEGHLPLVKLLLNVGADINSKACYGATPLYFAVQKGHLDVVKNLISAGADINTFTDEGFTLLYPTFLSNNSEKMFQLLVDSGFNPNLSSRSLCWAVRFNNIKCVKILLDTGAHVNGTDDEKPLHEAALQGNIHVMKLLLDYGADINARDKYGMTALHQAVLSRKLQPVKFVIEHGSLINSVNNNQETPLSLSIVKKPFDVAMLLINSGADLSLGLHNTMLNKAVRVNAPVEFIECLLEHGASVTTVYRHNTALQYVSFYSDYSNDKGLQIAKFLLIYGSNHYIEDDHGNTLLHWACGMDDVELVQYLLQYGLDVDSKNSEGKKAFDIAKEMGHTNIVKAIIKYHCNKFTSF